ncbi:hypothetical protein OKC48_21045 [Methylorubrum extorquens]|uniref:hypothetical protein n=1 Tax=Methylorubrum extorquens TaxID=408 RepID=UPI002237CE30|nr:hypothetical protein [Methylorubrum extorquens]UYW25735.1 hypothetical protein OKC48_21045 [Methylorubrum extorquens]
MTPTATPEALVERLTGMMTLPRHPTTPMKEAAARAVGGSWDLGHEAYAQAVAAAPADLLPSLLAALQQVTAERDAAVKTCEMTAMSGGFYARHAENTEARAVRAEAALATAEAASLRAEVEAKDRALKRIGNPDNRAEFMLMTSVEMREHARATLRECAARTALARAATAGEGRSDGAWPSGCIKPNACSRHRTCVYAMSAEKCQHFGQDLTAAIAQAEAPSTSAGGKTDV